MAKHGEWNRKGATLSDKTAKEEYGVSWEFIQKGIHAGRLDYRESAIWGNPFVRLLRRQLEEYIAEELGPGQLAERKNRTELRKIDREITTLKRKLKELQTRKEALGQR